MFEKLLNRFVRDPSTLSDEALEDTWIDTKSSLLVTCPYKQERAYSSLYDRCNNLMCFGIARRHRHLVLDAEAVSPFYKYVRLSAGVLRRIDHSLNDVPISVLPGLTLFAYTGGITKTTAGTVLSSPPFVMQAIDYLVDEKKLPIGLFLKGFVLKYGIQLPLMPNLKAAKEFLTAAEANGIGLATIELQHLWLHQHRRLSYVSSIHQDNNGYQKWVNEARLNS